VIFEIPETRVISGRYAQLRNLRNMTFEDFRLELEAELEKIVRFELQEFHYEPYSFGNGLLAYRINGRNYRFRYDGREKQMTVDASEQHQKYFGALWNHIATIDELSNGVAKAIELLNLSEDSK